MVEGLRLPSTRCAGVSEEIVGGYGYVLGGAVGDEVDRFDIALGSPEHAYVLGTSTDLATNINSSSRI